MTAIRVHVDIAGHPVAVGTAYVTLARGRVSTTFAYDAAYLADPRSYDIEPGLPRHAGQHYVEGLPGCFSDCAPDRWGAS
ncbi:MAG: HipA N-terminal domain-containing protein [Tetrasphaera sp.]